MERVEIALPLLRRLFAYAMTADLQGSLEVCSDSPEHPGVCQVCSDLEIIQAIIHGEPL